MPDTKRTSPPQHRRPTSPPAPRRPTSPTRLPSRLLSCSGLPLWLLFSGALALVLIVSGLLVNRARQLALPSPATTVAALSPTVGATALETSSIASETPTTALPITTPAATAASVPIAPLDQPALQQHMLDLINSDRAAAGLPAVAWDEAAAEAGLGHADEMVRYGYFSHWNLAGSGPDYRYAQMGGQYAVRENLFTYEYGVGSGPTDAASWRDLIAEAEQGLMNSPLHRATILSPESTHVGIGIVYDATTGRLRLAQEFVARHINLAPVVRHALLDSTVTVQGRLLGGTSKPVINVAYEPLPVPRSLSELAATEIYMSPAVTYATFSPSVGDGQFVQEIKLDYDGRPGLYHIRISVETGQGPVLTGDAIVTVG